MAFLNRISNSFWQYISPLKTENAHLPTPKTEPVFKKPAIPNRLAVHELTRRAQSMSPNERIGSWRLRSPSSSTASSTLRPMRKRRSTASPSAGRRRKRYRMEDEDEDRENYDTVMDDEYSTYNESEPEDRNDIESRDQEVRPAARRRERTTLSVSPEDDMSLNTTLVVEDEFAEPTSHRVVNLPDEHRMQDMSDDELRKKGWDDEYITLFQKIAMRGYEPLLPSYFKLDFPWLPVELFQADDDAFIGSVRGDHFKAAKTLKLLFDLGGRVRDRINLPGPISPERQMRRQIKAFNKWAQKDANIDQGTALPVLALEFQPSTVDTDVLLSNAAKKCRHMAAGYREALRVHRSVELSPEGSIRSEHTTLSYPLPTVYAIVGSEDKLAIMAYDPKKGPEEEPSYIAYLDFQNPGYDVWNSLALAIVVCHARNGQMVIAEDTGIGLMQPDLGDEMDVDDPDA